ncbi:putative threonine--tRNA ligase, cytoplasmic [Nosema granulosis]|uniref:Probable threonine--tRNA ligase, cytoplasmic n=1 Tax=Nosema granulosis TaxID=83296 RepID=A0A9P6KY84_9MICR|nr:putative threonine--tRNA ligase, cytoplasmic [Nosema granulosis]
MISIKCNNEKIEIQKGTTPREILKKKFSSLKNIVSCKINNKFADLTTQIVSEVDLEFVPFEDAKHIFWHSSAHILGNALVNLFPGCKLVNGPPTEEGFFYDVDIDTPISSDDFKNIENEMKKIIKKNLVFEKQQFTKEEILEMYKDNPCKTYFINKKVVDKSTVYRNGEFFDMCEGPHVYSTGEVKAVKIIKNSSAYFLNDPSQKQLQRIYGITFPTKEELFEWNKKREQAQKRDHRRLGKELDLFFFHEYSPGSCFFLPNGAYVYNKLVDFLREEYKARGFQEVITPNIFSTDLWKESGHYDNYKDNIFMIENENMALKPMNCPGHCVMFKSTDHSFRELPMRYADFGVLHRNELSGALTGLTRVRRFQQDDAHIFCTKEQVKEEIKACLDFLRHVYSVFKFKFELYLSTRPEKYIGEISEWDEAEKALASAIEEVGFEYTVNEGDGAFYGPKIDIILQDALGRKNQCATIQLDFQLPQRFKLKFRNSEGNLDTPVIIHRAILGSLERFIAILVENFGKKLPFWLNPRQLKVISIANDSYTEKVRDLFKDFKAEVVKDNNTVNKNIRNAIVEGYSLVCMIGEKEASEEKINLRLNDKQILYDLKEFKKILDSLNKNKIEFEEYLDLNKASLN